MEMRRSKYRTSLYLLVGLLLAVVTLLSPLLTSWLARYEADWNTLSLIGQSYGPAATILSGAALIGVIFTIRYQAKQTSVAAEQALRLMHLELLREAWRDPDLLQALTIIPQGKLEQARRGVFVNQFFQSLRMGWASGQVTLAEIEDLAAESFSTSTGSYWWGFVARDHMMKHEAPPFVAALDRGYERAQVRAVSPFLDEQDQREVFLSAPAAQPIPASAFTAQERSKKDGNQLVSSSLTAVVVVITPLAICYLSRRVREAVTVWARTSKN
jgi:uncharacterized protein DUF6082